MKAFQTIRLKVPNSLSVQHGIKDHSLPDEHASCRISARFPNRHETRLRKPLCLMTRCDSVARYGVEQTILLDSGPDVFASRLHESTASDDLTNMRIDPVFFSHTLNDGDICHRKTGMSSSYSDLFMQLPSVETKNYPEYCHYVRPTFGNFERNTPLQLDICLTCRDKWRKEGVPTCLYGSCNNVTNENSTNMIATRPGGRFCKKNFFPSATSLTRLKSSRISQVPSRAFSLSSSLVQPVKTLCSISKRDISDVKGDNSKSIHKRNQSSSTVILVPFVNKPTLLKQTTADCGKPLPFISARDYGKSIPVNQETVPVTTAEIRKFLQAQSLKFDQGHTCFITSCPRLTKRKLKLDEADKLYINMTTGSFVCHSCKKFGDWTQLQDNVNLLKGTRKKKDQECFPDMKDPYNIQSPAQISALWETSVPLKEIPYDELETLLHHAGLEALSLDVLGKYNVRVDETRESLLIPIYFVDNAIHALKKISMKMAEDGTPKGVKESIIPRGEVQGLFGWNTIDQNTTEVVLTASEFDAMAVYQETKVPTIALPKGDSVLPQEILPLLEQFTKIVLWFKNDIRSWEAARHFSRKLNVKRCFVIRPSSEHPNALEALQQKYNLYKILQQAKSVSHQSITSFSQLRQEVFSELAHVEQVAGVKWKKYPHLNKLLKGHRRGELTIFTGPTGSGKTTFISDYSLDLCMQGVNTLWGSFEINNVRLMKMMLTQFSQLNMSKHLTDFDMWADKFEMLPMYFMMFFGQESIKKVIETMSHAVYVHDIAHVIVDNLQFMMGVDADRQIVDRFQRQDQIVAAFRKFATTMNCHVTVVVHPRKEKDNDELTTASIYGSAKASQEADNVMILQDKRLMSLRGKKYLQIAKNRFDGELGVMLLKFDKETLSFEIKPQKKKEDKDGSTEGEATEDKPELEDSPDDN